MCACLCCNDLVDLQDNEISLYYSIKCNYQILQYSLVKIVYVPASPGNLSGMYTIMDLVLVTSRSLLIKNTCKFCGCTS